MKRHGARLLLHLANKLDLQSFREVVQPGAFRRTQESPVGFLTYNGKSVDMEDVVVTTLAKLKRQRRI